MSGFDFSTARIPDEAATLEVKHPSSGKVIATIQLLSIDADKPSTVRRRQERRRLAAGFRSRLDPNEIDADAIDLLVACTVGWTGIEWHGETLECNPKNVKMLYTEVKWLRNEVDRFVGDVSNFLEDSETQSETSPGTSSGSSSQ